MLQKMLKNLFCLEIPIFLCKFETHANIRRGIQDTAVPLSLFPSLYSSLRYFSDFPRSHVELLDATAYAKFGPRQWYPFISPVFWCLGQRAKAMSRELERNPIISLAGCHVGAAVTRQVFSFITYESGRPSSFQPDRGIKQDFTDEAR